MDPELRADLSVSGLFVRVNHNLLFAVYLTSDGWDRYLGKPFRLEMEVLGATYKWAIGAELGTLTEFSDRCRWRGLFAVGSGGSFSVATYAAFLQQRRGSQGVAITPLELTAAPPLRRYAVILYSAGGNNSDVLRGYHLALEAEAESMAVVCLRPGSKLTQLASNYESCYLWAQAGPASRDGFLATNGLLAFFVLTCRLFGGDEALPTTYDALTGASSIKGSIESVVGKEHLVVLYSSSTKAAAVDLESKMSEAGLASVQLTDFRNFAHGRHNWIAKKSRQTGVVAFVADEAEDIATRTLRELRGVCDAVTIRTTAEDRLASLACLPSTFELTRIAGELRNIDPGRPGVPEFGRRIYHLRPKLKPWIVGAPPSLDSIVDRKIQLFDSSLFPGVEKWKEVAKTSITDLRHAVYKAIVFDFDNTLCGPAERFGCLRPDVVTELTRLASAGLWMGIATGRGKSVRKQLQGSLSKKYWQQFTIGYYNGSDIGSLDQEDKPDAGKGDSWLSKLGEMIGGDSILKGLCEVTIRKQQLTVEPTKAVSTEWLWREVLRVTSTSGQTVSTWCSRRAQWTYFHWVLQKWRCWRIYL